MSLTARGSAAISLSQPQHGALGLLFLVKALLQKGLPAAVSNEVGAASPQDERLGERTGSSVSFIPGSTSGTLPFWHVPPSRLCRTVHGAASSPKTLAPLG